MKGVLACLIYHAKTVCGYLLLLLSLCYVCVLARGAGVATEKSAVCYEMILTLLISTVHDLRQPRLGRGGF